MSRFLFMASCFVLVACTPSTTTDAGSDEDAGSVDAGTERDAGTDAGSRPDASVELIDGGLLIYGRGCVSPDRNKIIFIVDSRYPQWCAYISMRRWDGGFPPMFPNFHPPEDFKVDDARYGVCRDLELPNSLDPNALVLEDLSGDFTYHEVYDGRPLSYDFDGGIQMGPYVFRAQLYAGVQRDCKGN